MERIEAIDIVKKNYPHVTESGSQFETALRILIPELKESEDDRIRKEIIKETKGSDVRLFETVTNDEFIAWLEKQGKQKPFDYENANIRQKDFASIEPDDLIEECYQHQAENIIDMVTEKSAWSEDDEKQARQIERIVHDDGCSQKLQKQIADWLKSIKERIGG